MKSRDEALIVYEYIYIVEGEQRCWKCRRKTRVIGLGISEYACIYGDINHPQFEESIAGEELHLAWTDNENNIPPKLLAYLKEHYSVKTGYSRTQESKCFANHCDHCGTLQGNWHLFNEPNSPLSTEVEGKRLQNRMNKLKIFAIPIDDDLLLDWEISFCDNDYAYFEYSTIESIILSSNPDDEYITYEELYHS